MIKYTFNEDLQILEVKYEGDIKTEDIINHGQFISKNNTLPRKLKILTDSRNVNYNISPDAIPELTKELKQNLTKYEFIMDAFLHSKPKETAYSILLEVEQKYNNYSHKVFTTKEAAIDWLK
jgi:hypothetical protein